jgi:hypothetical protein
MDQLLIRKIQYRASAILYVLETKPLFGVGAKKSKVMRPPGLAARRQLSFEHGS